MLNLLRKSTSSWVGLTVLALALGAMVVTMFGIGGPPGGGGGTVGTGPVLARIGKIGIGESEYMRMVSRAADQERQHTPELTVAGFVAGGGGRMVLDQMVSSRAMRAFADAHGMMVSKRMVDGEIASISAFQVNGEFNEDAYRRLLDQQQVSEQDLREDIASDLLRRQLLQPILLGNHVPRGMSEPFAALLLEVRKGEILPVPATAVAAPGKATDAQLQAFYDAHRAEYRVPERRAFRYARFGAADVAAVARPTAEDVRKYYAGHPGEFGGLEQRQVNAILLRDEASARKFVADVRAGKSFADVAKGLGFSAADVALGTQSHADLAAQVNKELADAAFALTPGTVGDPVKSPLGWHVAEVVKLVPATPVPFARVESDIASRLAADKQADLLAAMVTKADDRLAAGDPLATVAADLKLAVQTVPALTADGRLFDDNYQITRVEQPVLPKVFAADPADGPQVVEVASGDYALIEVTEVVPPEQAPLAKIRADVELAWQADTRLQTARQLAEAIATAASKGTASKGAALAAASQTAAKGVHLPPVQALTVRRLELTQMAQQGQEVPPPVLLMLGTPQGQARLIAAPGGQGWFVVRVAEVTPGKLDDAGQLIEAVQSGLTGDTANELADAYVRAIERQARVVRYDAQIKAANARMTGAGE